MDIEAVTRSIKRYDQVSSSARGGLRTAFYRTGERGFAGYVLDPNEMSRKFSVEILVDGFPLRVVRADALVHELVQERIGDGCYGFSCAVPIAALNDSAVVEARLANLGTAVGTPVASTLASDSASHPSPPASLRWLGGLRFSGWIDGRDDSATANVHVDGTLIARVRATAWTHVGTSEEDARAVRAFDFYLPERFADGSAHQLTMNDDAGENVGGQPLVFIAYPDGLRAAVAGQGISEQDRLRAELFDQLLPMSVPLSQYQSWRDRFPNLSCPPAVLRGAVIMVGPGVMDDTLESLQQQTHADWVAASLPQTSEPTGLHTELAQAFLNEDGADCEFVVFALAGTLFAPSALQRIASAFAEFANAQAVYTDLDIQSDDGSVWPLAFPAFDYERALEQGYCAYLFALRRDAAERALNNDAASLYHVFNSVLDDASAPYSNIVHLPEPLGTLPEFDKTTARLALAAATREHLKRKGIIAQAIPKLAGILPNVYIKRSFEHPRTAIIIPTRNRKALLQGCIETIRPAVERTQAEIVVVDNDSSDPDTLSYLTKLENRDATVLRVPGDFNFSRLNNYAAKAVDAEILCLLNNDIKALDDYWLEEMLGRISDVDVGAVGALLVWPSRVVQHGGVVLGPSFAATHAFNDRIDNDFGYGDLLCVAHECSAVTAACMVTRRRHYLDVGGMDEVRFPVNFNDVDYCLKVRASGKRIVFTPHAKLVHLESASRGLDVRSDMKKRFERELQNLRAKWGGILAADPYYSPMLSLDPIPFSALAWPSRAMQPRLNNLPIPTRAPFGF
jgi:GT2 family glycosyltransferase